MVAVTAAESLQIVLSRVARDAPASWKVEAVIMLQFDLRYRQIHLDFHTGLGPKGRCKLLIDYALTQHQRGWLADWFGANSFETCDSGRVAYDARGGFGR